MVGHEKSTIARLVPDDMSRNNFDFIRIFMAIAVVWSHSFALYFGSEDNEPVSLLLNGTYNSGNLAVRVFFVISGFLIFQSFLNSKSTSSYLRKRVMRIFPGFIVAVLICSFVIVPLFSTSVDLSGFTFLKSVGGAFLLTPIYPESDAFSHHYLDAINGSLWSIKYEFWCYIGIIMLGALKSNIRNVLLIFLVALAISIKIISDIFSIRIGVPIIDEIFGWNYIWFDIGPYFLLGSLIYIFRDNFPRQHMLIYVALALFVGLAYLSPIMARAFAPFAITYAVFFAAFSPIEFPKSAYGDFSFGTYLYSFPIQQMLIDVKLPFWAYVLAAMSLSILAGVLSWFLIERHFLARANRKRAPNDMPKAALSS